MIAATKPKPCNNIPVQKSLWLQAFAWLLARHVARQKKRRQRRALMTLVMLPDWQLRDIGISPVQLEQAHRNSKKKRADSAPTLPVCPRKGFW